MGGLSNLSKRVSVLQFVRGLRFLPGSNCIAGGRRIPAEWCAPDEMVCCKSQRCLMSLKGGGIVAFGGFQEEQEGVMKVELLAQVQGRYC